MTYLVTGAAGFIGARFVEECNVREIPVISIDSRESFLREEHRNVDFGTKIRRNDIRYYLYSERPQVDAVIHLGACTDTTETDLDYLTRANSLYSQDLWEFCTFNGVPFVYASSAATYGSGSLGFDDDENQVEMLCPLNPYGQSKNNFDRWALEGDSFRFSPPFWAGYKFFNVYGFGERHKGKMASVVLKAYDQIESTGKVTLFRSHRENIPDGHQKRDFIYVDDVVRILHWTLKQKAFRRGLFNLGTGKARTFLDLARAVFDALGRTPDVEFVDIPGELRHQYQYFTEAKMDKLAKHHPALSFCPLEQGIKQYVKRLEDHAK